MTQTKSAPRRFSPQPVDLTGLSNALRFSYVIRAANEQGVVEVDAGDVESLLVEFKTAMPAVFQPTGGTVTVDHDGTPLPAPRQEMGFDLVIANFAGKLPKLPDSIGDLKSTIFTMRRVLRIPDQVSYLEGTMAVFMAFMDAVGKLDSLKKNTTPSPASATSSPAPSASPTLPTP